MIRSLVLTGVALVSILAGRTADATLIDDPLHGYCAGVLQCIDNGTNSPTTTNPPANFGFTISPGPATGDFVVDILIPDNAPSPSTFGLTGTLTGTATLFSATAWTSGQLDAYLGIVASPANPIGAYLPSTQLVDAGAGGYRVYRADLGITTLKDAANPGGPPTETLNAAIPAGSYIVGFLNKGTALVPDWIATVNSGAIFETGTPSCRPGQTGTYPNCGRQEVPEPASMFVLGSGLLGLGAALRRKQRSR